MGRLPNTPSWGVLVKAPLEEVREILSSFGECLTFRENDGWTAAFYMPATDTSDDEAAELLRARGFVPVYHFDYAKYDYLTSRWDGERWELLKSGSLFVTPFSILRDVGIPPPTATPCQQNLPPSRSRPARSS
jgi:hypothetical protein